jgi:hypothetical protein
MPWFSDEYILAAAKYQYDRYAEGSYDSFGRYVFPPSFEYLPKDDQLFWNIKGRELLDTIKPICINKPLRTRDGTVGATFLGFSQRNPLFIRARLDNWDEFAEGTWAIDGRQEPGIEYEDHDDLVNA